MGHKVKQSLVNSRVDFFYYAFRNILLVSAPLLVLSALILGFSIPHSSATNSGSDSVTLTLSTSCTLSSSVITPHHASLNSGQYEEGIGNTRINTYCNDNNGYSIYAIGTSNNVDGNTDLVSDLDEHYNIHTGAYTNGNNIDTSTPSFWGMKLTPGIGTGSSSELTPPTIMNNYNSYNVIPSSYTLVASRTSGTNMTIDTDITGSYFNTTYNIYASSVQPAGSYEGKVKYVMIHPHSNNNHLGFNEAYALHNKTPITTENGTYYTMQDMDATICNQVGVYDEVSQTQLIDARDNKLYWVAKLQDGHCWMTQNLDLDLVTYINEQGQEVMKPLTSEDTDLTDYSLTDAYVDGYMYDINTGITTWTPERKTTNFQNTTMTGWDNDNNNPYSANKTDSTETGHASLGNYYNWTAAIASNDSSTLTQDTLNNIANNPQNSICPKGWRLPTISSQSGSDTGSTNEYARLNYLYNSNSATSDANLLISPLYFVRSGDIYNSSVRSMGQEGKYISGTLVGAACPYVFLFQNSLVDPAYTYPGTSLKRGNGYPVRCVTR